MYDNMDGDDDDDDHGDDYYSFYIPFIITFIIISFYFCHYDCCYSCYYFDYYIIINSKNMTIRITIIFYVDVDDVDVNDCADDDVEIVAVVVDDDGDEN